MGLPLLTIMRLCGIITKIFKSVQRDRQDWNINILGTGATVSMFLCVQPCLKSEAFIFIFDF